MENTAANWVILYEIRNSINADFMAHGIPYDMARAAVIVLR